MPLSDIDMIPDVSIPDCLSHCVTFLFSKSVFRYYKLGRGDNSVHLHLIQGFFLRNFILCMTFDSWTKICVTESNNIIYH